MMDLSKQDPDKSLTATAASPHRCNHYKNYNLHIHAKIGLSMFILLLCVYAD